ncbi:MAG: signal peptidase II [Candidatus Mcinerneyibacterium aminivorans]|uniref:Lipoprotein signal peptidase n=1 Tax=Candidatus Mcinerneyibacterium aminivorans TaxID=2703815 RepID=A0A5D0MD56_9BACT|nr:MAG: signal peptidase II [Candidatus Mcinerneyibacterium aminivorans]
MKKKLSHIKVFLFTAIVSFLLDLISKGIISSKMGLHESIPIIDNIFRLTYIKNEGIAFGLLQGIPHILLFISIAVLAIIIYLTKRISTKSIPVQIAFGLIIGGALGNIVDRIRFSSVRDFLDIGINHNLRWPIFNIADSAVFIGVILILIFYKENSKTEDI